VRVRLSDADRPDRQVAMVVVTLALPPLLLIGITRQLREMPTRAASAPRPDFDDIADHQPKVLVAGMGRFGQIVARLLVAQRIPFVALEHNLDTVEGLRRLGNELYYGDPTRPDLLRAAGGERIEVFVMAMDNPETNTKAVRLV